MKKKLFILDHPLQNKFFGESIKYISSSDLFDIQNIATPLDVLSSLEQMLDAYFYFYLETKDELEQIKFLLNQLKNKKNLNAFPMCMVNKNLLHLESELRSLGCLKVFRSNIESSIVLDFLRGRLGQDLGFNSLYGVQESLIELKVDNTEAQMQLEQLDQDEVIITTDNMFKINIGDTVPIHLFYKIEDRGLDIEFSGILEHEEYLEDGERKELYFSPKSLNQSLIDQFYELIAIKQNEIFNFMELVKGY